MEPVIVKKDRENLVNTDFCKKKPDTNRDTHCIKIGVQLWKQMTIMLRGRMVSQGFKKCETFKYLQFGINVTMQSASSWLIAPFSVPSSIISVLAWSNRAGH